VDSAVLEAECQEVEEPAEAGDGPFVN
jgi:hypothetical protein